MKPFRFAMLVASLSAFTAIPVLAQTQGVYVGRASTGEPVYYQSARFQCGDLPRNHECWTNTPMVAYTIGTDQVTAIANCRRGLFTEGSASSGAVIQNMRPASNALRKVLKMACSSGR